MPNTHKQVKSGVKKAGAVWVSDAGFWLSVDIEFRPQSGVWENVSWIPGYPHWVFKTKLPTIGPIFGPPVSPKLSIAVLKTHQRLAELRRIWEK